MTVYRYMVWDDTAGVDTARPFSRLIVCDSAVIADQPLDPGEAYDVAPDGFTIEEDDDVTDLLSFVYTVDTTATPKTVTAVSSNRFTLTERQDIQNRKVQRLLTDAATQALRLDTKFTETEMADLVTYTDALRAVPSQPGFPDTITWPTKPSFVGTDAATFLARSYRKATILAAVGLSSGVPTGGIIETATNVNGLYIRFADGGQICRARIVPGFFNSTRMATSWTFPAAFHSLSSYSFHATFSTHNNLNAVDGLADTVIRECQVMSRDRSTTSVDIHVLSPTYSFVSGDFVWLDISATGRWAA